jgi:beta-galactosidase
MRKYKLNYLYLFAALICTGCSMQTGNKNAPDIKKSIYEIQVRNGDDPFLTDLYLELNKSPMQEKLRSLKPFPVGVVYYQQRGDDLDIIRNEFRTINELGYTALKQVVLGSPGNPPGFTEQVFHAAIEEGITPWYYGRGGWINITQDLVDELGIAMELNDNTMAIIQEHPRMKEYQAKMLHERVDRMKKKPAIPKGMGEPGRNSPYIPDHLIPAFADWLSKTYSSVDALKDAWNFGYVESPPVKSFAEAAALMRAASVDRFGHRWGGMSWDFRRMRDAMRFQADLVVEHYNNTMHLYYDWDPEEPERTGGHQLFENQAINSWDLEAQAGTAAIGGSFYASIHLTHHFFLMDGELTHPVYMQSRMVADMFKGGWSATWESTGGPTQWSGHHNINVGGNTMQQLFLTYIAAGLKGIGVWMWNSRGEGWEAGEYALCDLQGEPTDRAVTGGKMSRLLQEQRYELWEALDEPVVGVLYSWENEAVLGRLSMGCYELSTPVFESNRDRQFRQFHSEARAGISRALMNHQIPFEYVTDRDIAAGLAARYPVIYMPFMLALDDRTLAGLKEYVNQGGRLVADFPLLMLDDYGRLNKHLNGSDFEELFGFCTADYLHASGSRKHFMSIPVNTRYGDLKITHGTVTELWDDGTPAIITSSHGKGQTLVFNFEAARSVFRPGNQLMEELIVSRTLGNIRPPFIVSGNKNSLVFRRAAPKADHFFIINPGDDEVIEISSEDINYTTITDIINNEAINLSEGKIKIKVPAGSGSWVRAVKTGGGRSSGS